MYLSWEVVGNPLWKNVFDEASSTQGGRVSQWLRGNFRPRCSNDSCCSCSGMKAAGPAVPPPGLCMICKDGACACLNTTKDGVANQQVKCWNVKRMRCCLKNENKE